MLCGVQRILFESVGESCHGDSIEAFKGSGSTHYQRRECDPTKIRGERKVG
jgi:hypothetical protein